MIAMQLVSQWVGALGRRVCGVGRILNDQFVTAICRVGRKGGVLRMVS